MKPEIYITNEKTIYTEENKFVKKRVFPDSEKSYHECIISLSEAPVCESFSGFGAAVTDSSCYELSIMPEDKRREFLKEIYSDDGVGLSVGRISIGASDYSPNVYSYCEKKDLELKSFSIENDEEYNIPMLHEILKINPEMKFFASPWSPPGWMTTSGLMRGGYMRREYVDCYADYIIKFIKAYEEAGIKVEAITPQNEPETHHFGCMPACIWHPDIEAEFVSVLRKKLNACGMDTQIWLYDHSFAGWARVAAQFKDFPNLINECDAVAFHYYDGAPEMVGDLKKEYPNVKWHYTEGGPRLYDNYGTDWCKWGMLISKSMNEGCGSFTGWNLLLDDCGEPNVGPFFCGGLATLNSQSGELSYSGQYHAFKHFAKFIKRGAKIYSVDIHGDYIPYANFPNKNVYISGTAAVNVDGSHVLVLVNPNEYKVQTQYFYNGKWWYAELLPGSVSTVVFE